jgi:sulfite dehydrogenase (cytochrome) subunit B
VGPAKPRASPPLALAACLLLASAQAAPVSYTLPEETADYKSGPNRDEVKANCSACHSVDYVQIQPRGDKFKMDFWQAEVTKDDQGLWRAD